MEDYPETGYTYPEPNVEALRERVNDPDNPGNVIDVSPRLKAGERHSKFALTDVGNCERLVEDHARDLVHVGGGKRSSNAGWFVWDGRRFRRDDTDEIMRRAKRTIKILLHEGVELGGEEGARVIKWGRQSQQRTRLEALIALAGSEPEVAHRADELDSDPMLLNLANGTIDLRTGRLRDHDPADLITKLAPVAHDPNATCPTWERCVEQWFVDPDAISYVQRAVGYTLTGDVGEQCMFVPDGRGANGKTTFIETIGDLLGDYGGSVEAVTLTAAASNRSIRSDIARLAGQRLVIASETEKTDRLATALIKQLTGNKRHVARFLYQNEFEFTRRFKIWLDVNHLPQVDDNSHAFWRRLRVVPFPNRFPIDKTLEPRLRAESAGILNWALRGCAAWQEHGLGDPPETIAHATADYRGREEDPLERWIRERIELAPGAFTTNADLHADWITWAENHAIEADESTTELGDGVMVVYGCHGNVRRGKTNNGRGFHGVRLVENTAP